VGQDTGEKGKGRERNMHKGEKRKMGIKWEIAEAEEDKKRRNESYILGTGEKTKRMEEQDRKRRIWRWEEDKNKKEDKRF
jgi:hypothetical protein